MKPEDRQALLARGWSWTARPTSREQSRAMPFRFAENPGGEGVVEGRWEGVPFMAGEVALGREGGIANAVLVPMPSAGPGLAIVPQLLGRLVRIDRPFGATGQDIGFESDAFSRAYWVSSPDRR